MRVGFAGTPDFAACVLAAIHENGYTIPLVLTQPDRPSGRGMALSASAVKRYAVAHGLPVQQPAGLRSADVQASLRQVRLDVLVVAAYGLILPQAVLDWPLHGCLNIHASLLPRWRGAAPIPRAIQAGDTVSGVSIMQMDTGLDTGPVVRREEVPIDADDTAGTLRRRLAAAGARLIVDVLGALERDAVLASTPQPEEGATYAAKIEHADRIVDWTTAAAVIDRQVRALSPAPGALVGWRGGAVRILAATRCEAAVAKSKTVVAGASDVHGASAPAASGANALAPSPSEDPGVVVAVSARGIDVRCGDGALLRLIELQPANGRRMPASAFAVGRAIAAGSRFESGLT